MNNTSAGRKQDEPDDIFLTLNKFSCNVWLKSTVYSKTKKLSVRWSSKLPTKFKQNIITDELDRAKESLVLNLDQIKLTGGADCSNLTLKVTKTPSPLGHLINIYSFIFTFSRLITTKRPSWTRTHWPDDYCIHIGRKITAESSPVGRTWNGNLWFLSANR